MESLKYLERPDQEDDDDDDGQPVLGGLFLGAVGIEEDSDAEKADEVAGIEVDEADKFDAAINWTDPTEDSSEDEEDAAFAAAGSGEALRKAVKDTTVRVGVPSDSSTRTVGAICGSGGLSKVVAQQVEVDHDPFQTETGDPWKGGTFLQMAPQSVPLSWELAEKSKSYAASFNDKLQAIQRLSDEAAELQKHTSSASTKALTSVKAEGGNSVSSNTSVDSEISIAANFMAKLKIITDKYSPKEHIIRDSDSERASPTLGSNGCELPFTDDDSSAAGLRSTPERLRQVSKPEQCDTANAPSGRTSLVAWEITPKHSTWKRKNRFAKQSQTPPASHIEETTPPAAPRLEETKPLTPSSLFRESGLEGFQ